MFIGASLGAGFLFAQLWHKHKLDPARLTRVRTRIQLLCLLGINPVTFTGSTWILSLEQAQLFALPVVGLFTLAAGFLVSTILRRPAGKMSAAQSISFRTAPSFTNLGNIGGLVVFLLLGEAAFGLVPFYKLFEEFWYFGILFPWSRTQSMKHGLLPNDASGRHPLLKLLTEPFILTVLAAIAIGFGLNISKTPRPAWYGNVNAILIPLSSILLLFSVGTQIRLSGIRSVLRPALLVTAVKLTLLPLIALGTASLLGLSAVPFAMPTVLILSCMPMAFVSLVPTNLYKLDNDFTSALWLISMASLFISVPVLALIVPLM